MAKDKETKDRPYRSTTPERTSYSEREPNISSTGLARRGPTSLSYGAGSPFSMMRRFAEDMDRIFNDFGVGGSLMGSDMWAEPALTAQRFWTPEVETFRRGDQIVVRADLPGLNKDNVNVEIEEDRLMISGERQDEYKEERDDYYRTERSYGRFYRAIPLPEGVDENKINATFKDGVLEVTVPAPKSEEQHERKRIDIK